MDTDFPTFFKSLDAKQRARFAADAGTTDEYIEHHLLRGRRLPRRALLGALVSAAAKHGARFKPEQILASLMSTGESKAA